MTSKSTSTPAIEEVDLLFDRIEQALDGDLDDHTRSRIAKLQRLVDEKTASERTNAPDAHVKLARSAMEIMSSNVKTPLTITQIALECGVSPTLLKQTFKSVVGVPVYQWYRRHRISRACTLLSETDLSIVQISAAIGYSNSSKFAKAFREETGMTPRAWRSAYEDGASSASSANS